MKKKTLLILAVGVVGIVNLFSMKSVFADCAGVATGTINCDGNNGVTALLALGLNILTYGVGIAGVIGILISGYEYMTAADNPSKMTQAKNRIIQVVIGLLCYAALWVGLRFLMPGDLEQNLKKVEDVQTVENDKDVNKSETKDKTEENNESGSGTTTTE